MKRNILIFTTLFLAAILVGCGDDSASSPSNDVVENDSVLGICGKSNFGEIKSKNPAEYQAGDTTYYCSIAGWIDATHWSWDVPKEARLNPNIDYGTMTDGRDGQTYKTVKIGTQIWMAENLNYDYKINGESYGNWCYGDTARYCAVAGHLYTWAAMMDTASTGCGFEVECTVSAGRVRGVCPNGWHLPNTAEWNALFDAVGGKRTAGKALKATSGWGENGNGTDAFGFSAFPSGYRDRDGNFSHTGDYAYFWSSAEDGTGSAYTMELAMYSVEAYYEGRCFSTGYGNGNSYKNYGYAVRCLRD